MYVRVSPCMVYTDSIAPGHFTLCKMFSDIINIRMVVCLVSCMKSLRLCVTIMYMYTLMQQPHMEICQICSVIQVQFWVAEQ